MPVRFNCEHCGQRLSVTERHAGRKAKCPRCKQSLLVPTASSDADDGERSRAGENAPDDARAAGRKSRAGVAKGDRGTAATSAASSGERRLSPSQASPSPSTDIGRAGAAHIASSAGSPALDDSPETQGEPFPGVAVEGSQFPAVGSETGDDDPFSEYTVYDEWVIDTGDDAGPIDERPFDRNRVSVARSVVYVQGVLLGGVALVFFALGVLVGGAGSSRDEQESGPIACRIEGRVSFRDVDATAAPDEGAVVVVVPQDALPEATNKFAATALRPGSDAGEQEEQVRRAIRQLGGDFARIGPDGQYALQVPDRGKYFVLVLSHNSRRSADERPRPTDLAQMGRYFLPPDELLSDYRYEWRDETIRRDKPINVVF